MRDILFKAKRLDNGKWIEGNLLISLDSDEDFRAIIIPLRDSNMFTDNSERDLGVECWFKVDTKTVCEYTGIDDKSGNKIFEYDRLGHEMNIVEMMNGDWCVNGDRPLFFMAKEYEVLGNLFD